ncbi:MAG: polysaccharide pyruvyl transferase CsaB [Firmicutes bacterium]|nr:polysaccharide pyruvyl transferase CsaB [Bacillota bacterium]
MYRILISGYYGFNNIGDESILRTMIDNLREKFDDIEITVLSQDPLDTMEKYGVHAVERMSPTKIIGAIRHCDVLLFGGGSLLQDVTSSTSIFYYLSIIRMAKLFGKKVLLYSQGVGPIGRPLNRKLTSSVLKKVDEIAVRDEASAKLLKEIGVDPQKITVTADPVMRAHRGDPNRGTEILQSLGYEKHQDKAIMGWAIKSNDLKAPFLDEIAKSITWLKEERGVDSVLIPFHYEQDAVVVKTIAEKVEGKVCAITEKYLSDEMLSIIGSLDYLVGVRLHSLIFAAIMEVPAMAVSYDPKINAFMESVGGKCIADTDDFTFECFRDAFDHTVAHREEMIAVTAEKTAELTARLDRYDETIGAVIQSCKGHEGSPRPVVSSVSAEDAKPAEEENIAPPKKEKKKKTGLAAIIGGVMMLTILAKVFGILRESIQANVFGAVDSFYASYNKTIYLFTTIAYAMCIAAVPFITKAMAKSRKEGEAVANNLVTFSLLLALIGLFFWELVTVPGIADLLMVNPAADMLLFMRIMALTLPFIVVTYLLVAVFQSMDHFTLQGTMSLPYSVFLILFLLVFAKSGSLIPYVIAVSVAWLLQFAMTIPYAVKERYVYKPRLDLKSGYLGSFTKMVIVTIVTTSAYLFCYLIDASHAEQIGPGVTTAFYYADKIFTPLVTTFIYSIGVVLFPKLNRKFAGTNYREYMEYVWTITSNTLVIVFPVCAILTVLGEPMITVLFESGEFTPTDTAATTAVFMMYALGMAGFSVIDLLNKSFFTMNRLFAPFAISLLVIGLNAALDAMVGLNGAMVALSTAVVMSVGAVITVMVMFRKKECRGIVKLDSAIKSFVIALVVGAVAWILKDLILLDSDGKILLIVKSVGIGIVGMAVFFVGSYILKLKEITDIINKRRK